MAFTLLHEALSKASPRDAAPRAVRAALNGAIRSTAAHVCVIGETGVGDSPAFPGVVGLPMKKAAVLVVEGNANGLASLVEPLRKAGYRAVGTASFETARHLLRTQWYDVLITDLRLAAYNGLHLVFHSRAVNPATAAIIVAAIPDDSSEVEARRLGAHYLARPASPESLLALVATVLEGARYQVPIPL